MDSALLPPGDRRRVRSSPAGATVSFLLALATAAIPVLLGAEPAAAQYFGRNKVQYDDFDFRILETEHFRVHYDEQSEEAVRDAARMAERWYDRLARTFQHEFREKKPLILYADKPDFQQTNTISGPISQATGGVTEGLKDRVIMPFAESYGETDHVLGHELVHAFQFDLAKARRMGGGGRGGGFRDLPLWSIEGLAEYLSVGRRSSHTAMWMRDAVLRDELPSVEDLSRSAEFFPYRFGHALWAYIGGRWGDDAVIAFFRTAAEGGLQAASDRVLGLPLDTLSRDWAETTRQHYTSAMEGRSDPNEVGSRIVPREAGEGGLTLSPSVSPDGSRVVYLGQRDVFTIDLWVADARTGEIEGKLASAETSPHLDALAYMNTSGTWSPDGRRFAFATFAEGDNQIAVADVEDRSVERRYDLSGVGGVYSLDWSPDGERILFAGTAGGVTDLYMLDVEEGAVEQLTDDPWTELHPAFSPDGSTVAFSTDRGGHSDLERLRFGETGLGFLDLRTGEIEVLRPFPDAKHVNPRWTPDGSSMFFISDRDGFSDVYRMSLDDGTLRRVTRIATGVTGLTELAPALTVARDGGEVLFTVFRDGEYTVRRLAAQETRGEALDGERTVADAGLLPPPDQRDPARVAAYLDDPATGLPDAGTFEAHDYDSSLSLDFVTQPTGGVSVDRFGTALGGSVAAFFSDMLGNRQLGLAIQANGRVQDIGGQAVYQNQESRTDWFLQAGRIPLRMIRARRGTGELNGETLATLDLIVERMIFNRVGAGLRYPFSTTRRFELEAGATRIGFDREVIRNFIAGGRVVDRREEDLDAPDALHIVNASTALVEDRSFTGFTSPVRGSRGRLEVEGNVGDLQYGTLLGDYRRYLFANPLTLALRGFHYGRYGGDAESPRLTPLYLGYDQFIRGYEINSFAQDECSEVGGNPEACPEFDRLVGSRIGVANVELRIPLIGTEQFGVFDWGYVPTELSFFADAGVAWTSDESPTFEFRKHSTERIPVVSAGASLRFNVLGRLVFEAYYARPYQRPDVGGVWGFQLAPGW